MFPPRFTLPTRTPSKPTAGAPAPRAKAKAKAKMPPQAQPVQPRLSARQRRRARRAAQQQAALLVPPSLPPPPVLASVLSNRTAWSRPTIRRLEAGATRGAAACSAGFQPANAPMGQHPPRLRATSCALSALVPPELRERLHREIGQRLARHFEAPQWEYPIWLSEQTQPMWGAQARRVFAGQSLRKMRLDDLRWLILYEAERLARILVERQGRTLAERIVALRGTLRRIGQVYRELRWRCGEARALAHVNLALSALLWW